MKRAGSWIAARVGAVVAVAAASSVGVPHPAIAGFPGENGRIATEYGGTILTADPDGSDVRWMDVGAMYDGSPEFSPDGSLIAFDSNAGDGRDIWVMSADGDGSDRVRVTSDPVDEGGPHWSPDGTSLAFSAAGGSGDMDLYVVGVDGSDRRALRATASNEFAMEWSPDGSTILFASDADGSYDIWAVNEDGTNPRNLTSDLPPWSFEADAVWSPDGSTIAFFSDVEGRDIWTMAPDGTGKAKIGPGEKMAYSPDGRWIAFGDGQVNMMRTNGSVLASPGLQGSWPDWQPVASSDGTFIHVGQSLDSSLNEGASATISVRLSNLGSANATGVRLEEDLPPELLLTAASSTHGSCAIGDPATCDVDTIAAGEQAVITLTVTPVAGSGDTFTSIVATVTADDAASSTSTLDIAIAPPPLEIAASVKDGRLATSTGALSVSGRLTCNNDTFVYGQGRIRQRVGRAYVSGVFGVGVECRDGSASFVSDVERQSDRPWVAGKATVLEFWLEGCDGWTCDRFDDAVPRTIQIKPV
jgi:TolB protein